MEEKCTTEVQPTDHTESGEKECASEEVKSDPVSESHIHCDESADTGNVPTDTSAQDIRKEDSSGEQVETSSSKDKQKTNSSIKHERQNSGGSIGRDRKDSGSGPRDRHDSGGSWDTGWKGGGRDRKESDGARDRKDSGTTGGRDRRDSWKKNDKGGMHGSGPKRFERDKDHDWDGRYEKSDSHKGGNDHHDKGNSRRQPGPHDSCAKDKGIAKSKSDSDQPTGASKGSSGRVEERTAGGDCKDEKYGKGKKGHDDRHGMGAKSGRDNGNGGGEGAGRGRSKGYGDSERDRSSKYDRKKIGSDRRDSERHKDYGGERNKNKSGKDQVDVASGADLLNLLQKPGKSGTKGKGREIRDKGKSAADLEAKWQKEEEEKRKREEEEKRKEEEEKRKEEEKRLAEEQRIREEEERKKREEEEAQRLKEEEIRSMEEYVSENKERIEMKAAMRLTNLKAADHRPDESFFSKLDSSLKKNTAFVKKLKNITELQKDSLTKDFNGLNLTKYIGEAAAAITEAKLKMSDISCGLHICSLMHQRYYDFSAALLENWQKVLLNKKDEKIANPSKLRVDLRFFAELVAVGVFTQKEGLSVLANQLTILISNDKEEHNNLSIILSFCKHCGDDYAGLVSLKFRLLSEKYNTELPRSQFLPAERQKACRNLLKEYFSSLCRHLVKDHKDLMNLEKLNRKILQTKGELSTERKERFENLQLVYQKLLTNCATFADLLDEDMPDLPEDEFKSDMDSMGLDIFSPMRNAEYQYDGDATLFEDDDTRTFYETLPDLKSLIPGILYKDSAQTGDVTTEETTTDTELEDDMEKLNVEDIEKEMELEQKKQEHQESEIQDKEVVDADESQDEKSKPKADFKEVEDIVLEDLDIPDVEDDADDVGGSMKLMLETYLQNLPNSVNRELIDKAAIEFCMSLNTKTNRKKLVRALFTVHRTRYDLLPFYSRLVATLHPCMPDVASDLVFVLKNDFKWHVRKKDQINIESKMKTVRFIGELVKFKMFPKSEALHCLKLLLFDFSHHNIEMACALLETCGRFLYRSPDSHHRSKVYLDVMMRKKAALHLDSRYATMIENAYYYSNPPEAKLEARKERPPMHEYIRKLLYKDLSKITTEKVLRQLRKLNWDDLEICYYAVKCLTAIWNVRYNSIHCAANLLAGLAPYHEHVAIQVVDGVLEDIRVGLEVNHPKYNQRRVSDVKYLGELYNYRMVESAVVFKTLYTFISFGITLDDNIPSLLDPPEHLFRIRLVCVLLDTCGQYFDRGSSKKKLDCFLVYFQRYYWFKRSSSTWSADRPFPMDVEYMLRDTMETLRPRLKIAENNEEACAAAEELDKEFRAKLVEILPIEETGDGEEENGLPAIQETDEADELSQGLSQLHMTDEHSSQDSDLGGEERTGSQSMSQPSRRVRPDDEGEEGEGLVQTGDGEEHEEGEESEDMMESAGEEEEEDQFTLLTGVKHVKCAEDEDFMTAFDKMMADNIQARINEAVKITQVDIAVPMHLRGQRPKATTVVPMPGTSPPSEPEVEEKKDVINFVLMTKKGNKQQFTTLDVPITAEFASKFKERAQAERAEKERMKRVVLDIHERQEEEDYQEMLAAMSRPAPANMNRERRLRYQHPKGAPDADLIFGSK